MSFELLSLLGEEIQESTFKLTVGWIGNALALFFFFSPAVKMYALLKEKISHTEFSYFSLMANIMNCLLWFIYGFRRDTLEIWLCNGIGGTTSLIYLIIFWFYFCEKNTLKFSGIVFATLAVLAGIFSVFYWAFDSYEVAGKSAMVFNVIMYAAPGQKLIEVFKTEKYELLPIEMSVIGLLCSLSWFTYSILDNNNLNIMIPNSLGIVFSIIQIVTWAYYYRKAQNNTPQLQQFLGQTEDKCATDSEKI